jgi:hypothetical protein
MVSQTAQTKQNEPSICVMKCKHNEMGSLHPQSSKYDTNQYLLLHLPCDMYEYMGVQMSVLLTSTPTFHLMR